MADLEIHDHSTSLRQLTRPQRKAFAAAWLGYLLDGFDFVIITLVLTEISKDFHLSLPVAATLVSAAFVSRWLGGLIIGSLGDRFGRRPAMVLSILLYALGSLLCGFAWGYWSLFAFRAVVGLGMAGEYGSSTTFVMESWPLALRNRASGFLLSAYPIGALLAARAYAVIVPHSSWRVLFYLGIIPAALAFWLRRSLPEAAEWQADQTVQRRGLTSASALLTGRRAPVNVAVAALLTLDLVLIFSGHAGNWYPLLIALAAAAFISYAAQITGSLWAMAVGLMVTVFSAFLFSWPIQSLLPTYLKSNLHYDVGQVANALTWGNLGYAAGSIVAGILGDKFGTRRAYCSGLLVSAALVFPVFALGRGQIAVMWLLLFVLQFFGSGFSGLLPKFIGDHFPVNVRAAGLGFTYNVGALGGAVAPVVGARIGTHLGLGPALAWLTVSLTAVTVLLVAGDVPRRLGRLRHSAADPDPAHQIPTGAVA